MLNTFNKWYYVSGREAGVLFGNLVVALFNTKGPRVGLAYREYNQEVVVTQNLTEALN